MKGIVLVACTNVGRSIIQEMINNEKIETKLLGIVNLNKKQSLTKANYDDYYDLSIQYNIPIHYCNNINDDKTYNWIKSLNPELIIQSGWSQKFDARLLNLAKYGCIGEHPAPLPKGRGAACINWAILTGEKEWGDSFFRMVEQFDAGELYAQEIFMIEDYDNVKTVYDKVANCTAMIIKNHIDQWANGKFLPIEQDMSKKTYYNRRRPADGLIDFNKNSKEVYDFIRALTIPYPCAFFVYNDKKVNVINSKVNNIQSNKNIGEVITVTNNGVVIQCAKNTAIELLYICIEGYSPMWGNYLVNY